MADYLSLTDEQLVLFCRDDDEKAWDELSKRYLEVSKILSSKFKSEAVEADDLVSEGLIGFLSSVYSYTEEFAASFRTFAGACIRNSMLNCVRKAEAKKNIPVSKCLSLEQQLNFPDSSLSPEQSLISKNEAERISNIIDFCLSKNEKEVFILHLLGNSYSEICRKTGFSIKAVDGALQRARKKLRTQL